MILNPGLKKADRDIDASFSVGAQLAKETEAKMADDRAKGYLVGQEIEDWKKKQYKLVDSFLSGLSEDVFNAANGTFIALRAYKTAKDWIEDTRADLLNRKRCVAFPSGLVKGGKLNVDPLSSLRQRNTYTHNGMMIHSEEIIPILVEAQDPPFEIPKGKAVYELFDNGKIVFYVLLGNSLHIATDDGVVVERLSGYEGHKAKLARLAAEEAERKRLEELDRIKRAEEAEIARQASQLDKLKSLPSEKFAKLMKLING